MNDPRYTKEVEMLFDTVSVYIKRREKEAYEHVKSKTFVRKRQWFGKKQTFEEVFAEAHEWADATIKLLEENESNPFI